VAETCQKLSVFLLGYLLDAGSGATLQCRIQEADVGQWSQHKKQMDSRPIRLQAKQVNFNPVDVRVQAGASKRATF